jgi:hypothetical protein
VRSPGYPAPRPDVRPRAPGPIPLPTAPYYEGTNGTVALTAADAEIIVFSGLPDQIVLSSFVQDALVTLTDEHGRSGYVMRIPAGTPVTAPVRRRRVVARESAIGSVLGVVGYFRE